MHERSRQTGLLWQYRAMHYSALRGKTIMWYKNTGHQLHDSFCKPVRPMQLDRCTVLSCPVMSVFLCVLSVCDAGVLWSNGWMDQDETWHAGSPRPRQHCFRWGPSSPQKGLSPNFRPMSAVAKWLDGLRCHLVWREALAQATLC